MATTLNKKTILNDFDNMLEKFDKEKVEGEYFKHRDLYLGFIVKTYKTKQQRMKIADTLASYWSEKNDDNYDHWSIVMDVVSSMTFLAGDFDNTEFLLKEIEPHPKSKLRELIAMSVDACRRGAAKPKEFEECFNV